TTTCVSRFDVERTSMPQAEMRTAGVIIAESTWTADDNWSIRIFFLQSLIAARLPAKVVDEYGLRAVTQRIRSTNAPTVNAYAVSTHPQPHEVFEPGVIQRRKRLHIFVTQQREQRKIGTKDQGPGEDVGGKRC